jgi:uncharacterized protein (TIGR02145 family)
VFTRQKMRWTLLLTAAIAAVAAIWFCGCSGESIGEALAAVGHGDSGGEGGGGGGGNTTPNTVINGTFTDSRNNQTYKTVKIGSQTWMAENLNYQTSSGSWCYGNSADNCRKYGRLYDWNTAKNVCPSRWHLPGSVEWDNLENAVGGSRTAGSKLKSSSGWNYYSGISSTDDGYGFSALPGGRNSGNSGGNLDNAGYYGYWWTATECDGDCAYYRGMGYNYVNVYEGRGYKSNRQSVRCVAD